MKWKKKSIYLFKTRSQLLPVSSSIACRAVRLCNSMPINRSFKPIRKPQDSDIKTRVWDILFFDKWKFFFFSRDKKIEHYYRQINYVKHFLSKYQIDLSIICRLWLFRRRIFYYYFTLSSVFIENITFFNDKYEQ
jgi:hypothetical protein